MFSLQTGTLLTNAGVLFLTSHITLNERISASEAIETEIPYHLWCERVSEELTRALSRGQGEDSRPRESREAKG